MGKPIIFVSLVFFLGWVGLASASDEEQFNEALIEDAQTVDEAVEDIKATLEEQGFEIIGVVDHQAGAASISLDLRPTQLILFSNKRQERRLIRRGQTLAIDFPQKILVWEDEGGSIRVFYNRPGYLADRHRLRLRDFRLERIAKTLNQFDELENGLITVDSPFSVDDTIANLTGVIENVEGNPFRIPFTIDFSDAGKFRIFNTRPTTLLIFGNPRAGTPLMQNQQRIGVDLPQKFLVWDDRDGQVHVTYNDIFFLAKRHGLQVDPELENILNNISNALANFATAATTPSE